MANKAELGLCLWRVVFMGRQRADIGGAAQLFDPCADAFSGGAATSFWQERGQRDTGDEGVGEPVKRAKQHRLASRRQRPTKVPTWFSALSGGIA